MAPHTEADESPHKSPKIEKEKKKSLIKTTKEDVDARVSQPKKRKDKDIAHVVVVDGMREEETHLPEERRKRRKEKSKEDITGLAIIDSSTEPKSKRLGEGAEGGELVDNGNTEGSKISTLDAGDRADVAERSHSGGRPTATKKRKRREEAVEDTQGRDQDLKTEKEPKRPKKQVEDADSSGTKDVKIKKTKKATAGSKESPMKISSALFPDPKLSDVGRKALVYAAEHYAHTHERNESVEWKFNKARQNWIVRNVFNVTAIPDAYLDHVLNYLKTIQGGGKQALLKTGSTIFEAKVDSGTDGSNKDTGDDTALPDQAPIVSGEDDIKRVERARVVFIALSP